MPQGAGNAIRVLVVGGSGMLGRDVVAEFARRGWSVASPAHADLDVVFRPHLEALAAGAYGQFDWVVNCAAYTDVDRAEEEFVAATMLNGIAPGSLAFASHQNGWRFLHVSSDFVFDGEAAAPYTESALPNPIQAYGRTKLMGEDQTFQFCPEAVVCRTSWLFGPFGRCFPGTMIDAWRAGRRLRVVADRSGTPTSTAGLARTMAELISADAPRGLYHTAGSETMTWHDLAIRALEAYRRVRDVSTPIGVEPVSSSEWPTPARRPRMSALASERLASLGVHPMGGLDAALEDFVRRRPPVETEGLA